MTDEEVEDRFYQWLKKKPEAARELLDGVYMKLSVPCSASVCDAGLLEPHILSWKTTGAVYTLTERGRDIAVLALL